jgi:membrane-anchored protein YejM (alkaline phosphatase superfamily)
MVSHKLTPNIFAFKEKSLQYLNYYSGRNNTRHGMFSLMYGIPGNYWDSVLKEQQSPVLMETLINQDYQAQIFAPAKLTFPEFDQTLFSDIPSLRLTSEGNKPWQRDEKLTKDYLDWSSNNSQKKPVSAYYFSIQLMDFLCLMIIKSFLNRA